MGFVDDDSDSEAEANTLTPEADEESSLLSDGKERLFSYHRTSRPISWPNDPRTPTPHKDSLSSIHRLRSKKGITESDEIWEELEDGGDTPASPSPFSRRKSSAQTTPYFRPPATSMSGGRDSVMSEESPTESTVLLHAGSGRNYRDKRRRRSTPGVETRRRSVDNRNQSQEAVGGWWKMKRWWYGSTETTKGKGKGKDRDSSPNTGDRTGA